MKKFILYLCLPLVSFVLLASCIKENMDGCDRCIVFEYYADGETDVFPNHITSVSLYVFDNENQLVEPSRLGGKNPIRLEQNDLKREQGITLPLNHGVYRLVGVGNDYEKTEVYNANCGEMPNITFRHPDCLSREVEGNDSLYLGSKLIEIDENEVYFKDVVRFYSSHLKVLYTVKDYVVTGSQSSTRAETSALQLRVKNLHPETAFDQAHPENLAEGDMVVYNPELKQIDGTWDHQVYFHIMRHGFDNDVVFELVDTTTGEVIHTLELARFLQQYPLININKQEVLIPIEVVFKNAAITVQIPEWYIHYITPDFDEDQDDAEDSTDNN
ncbi:MAG: FimB/Mfa2 family fimbrial subunit [Alistipes sp.]|nr:FimB/Mfa2 family fimbrial subunit [Alistipes sp.]